MQWYWVDLAIIGVIALSVITGIVRGFLKELIALFVWGAGIWLAYNYSQALEPWLSQYIQDKTVCGVAGFVIILVSVIVIGGIFNAMLGFILKRSGMGGTDRTLGMVFGFVRGVFIVSLIMVIVKMTSLPHEEYARESKLYARFDPVVSWMYGLMPEFIKKANELDKDRTLVDVPEVIHTA
ncbi:CvpA family protein [Legionella dresdenensis]|uniref:CvpA family protein n=1 Tax=Legionella dresdenensis TaxID=450200 RepID=A0ABV8CCC5_9GAMM